MQKKVTLRSYQSETILRLIQNYKEKKRRNLCVLATGLGKTYIATKFHHMFKPKEKTLFLVDRIELAFQARDAFQKTNPELRVGIEMDKYHASKKDDIVVACVHTVGRKGSFRLGKFTPDDFTKIMVDEAHMSVSDTFVRVLSYMGVGPDSSIDDKMLIGFTATPNRTDKLSLGYLYDDIPVNYDLKYGIKEGWLTDIELIQIETGIDVSNVTSNRKDFNLTKLDKAINIDSRNALILKAYQTYLDNKSAIIYCTTVEHAKQLTEIFNHKGIPSACIEAKTDAVERQRYVSEYKKGKIKCLFNYGTLTTGFDAPETTGIILARPIKSDLLLRQMIGRGLRPSVMAMVDMFDSADHRKRAIDDSIKPNCKVIDLCDMVGGHRIVSVPSLFGLNPRLKTKKEQQKFFQDVVEPLEQFQKDKQVDLSTIDNYEDIDMIVRTKKIDLQSLKVPKFMSQFTDRSWLKVGDDSYEITYPKDRKTLIVSKNTLDKYDLLEYDPKHKITRKLNDFFDLSGAIKIGDEYADRHYNTEWLKFKPKESKGVTTGQYRLLRQILKGGLKVDRNKFYPDTEVPELTYRRTGEVLDRQSAFDLITRITK